MDYHWAEHFELLYNLFSLQNPFYESDEIVMTHFFQLLIRLLLTHPIDSHARTRIKMEKNSFNKK